jgi:hypothetical protein
LKRIADDQTDFRNNYLSISERSDSTHKAIETDNPGQEKVKIVALGIVV